MGKVKSVEELSLEFTHLQVEVGFKIDSDSYPLKRDQKIKCSSATLPLTEITKKIILVEFYTDDITILVIVEPEMERFKIEYKGDISNITFKASSKLWT